MNKRQEEPMKAQESERVEKALEDHAYQQISQYREFRLEKVKTLKAIVTNSGHSSYREAKKRIASYVQEVEGDFHALELLRDVEGIVEKENVHRLIASENVPAHILENLTKEFA